MRKTYLFMNRLVLLIMVGAFSVFASAQTAISDAAGLAAISDDLAGDYVLTADIDLVSPWTPLGKFTGTLDGAGHIISGLTVDDSGTAERALFSQTGTGALIKNLGIEGASINGNERVGAIVGLMDGGTVQECYVANSYIEGRDHVGSIAGQIKNGAIIQNCYSTSDVYSREWQAGGLVGVINDNDTKILNSYFSGLVRCNGSRPSGIVALRDAGAPEVNSCVNLAPYILGRDNLRVVGHESITMSNLYSISTCKLSTDITNYNGGTVPTDDGNYGTDKRHGANIPGGDANALGSDFYENTLGWDFTNTWKMLGDGYPVLAWETAVVNSAALRLKSSYTLQNGDQIDLNELFSNRGLTMTFSTTSDKLSIEGNIATAQNINSPESAIIEIDVNADFEIANIEVSLLPTGAITISTPAELLNVSNLSTFDFELSNDIDMTGVEFNGLCSSGTPYTGTFDGKGHIIKGLSYNNSGTNSMGLFVATDGATIKNLGIESANIVGRNDIAGVVGLMKGGLMEKCYVANSYIEGQDHVASLAGKVYNGAVIENCYGTANVYSRSSQAGGLGGVILDANSKISKSYFSGKVNIPTNKDRTGGIVALVDNDNGIIIEYCVNLASDLTGGASWRIVHKTGRNNSVLTSNYSLSTTRMNQYGYVIPTDDSNYGADKEHGENIPGGDANALSADFYETTLGWDFTETTGDWKMLADGGYPVLEWQTVTPEVSVISTKDKSINTSESIDLNALVSVSNASNTYTFSSADDVTIDTNNVLTFNNADATVEIATVTIESASGFALTSGSKTSFIVSYVPDAVDPIEISTIAELMLVTSNPSRNFKLMADLDMTGVTFDGLCSVDNPFTGIFDGNGHVISNFTIPSKSYKGVGLFNATRGATVKKLGVEGATVTGTNQNVGIIIGQMQAGVLEECYVLNSQANGYDHVGSLVGGANENGSDGVSIRNCYANSNVHSTNYQAGGLIGTVRKGVVEKCYFAGEVISASDRAVGLAGYHDNSGASEGDIIIRNNLNIASLIETKNYELDKLFRIFDNNGDRLCTLENNYSISTTELSKTSNNTTAVATVELTDDGRNGANLADDADAMKEMFYTGTLGWDFTDVWKIDEGVDYPVLDVFSSFTTEINDVKSSLKSIGIYPNPVVKSQSFKINNQTSGVVQIYSLQGLLVSQFEISSNEYISTKNLSLGTYILKFTSSNITKKAKLIVR